VSTAIPETIVTRPVVEARTDILPPRRALLATVLAVGVVLAALDIWASTRIGSTIDLIILLSLPQVTYLVIGVVLWARRPDSRTGMLMVAAAYAAFIGGLWGLKTSLLVTLGFGLQGLDGAIRSQMLLAYPTGRLGSRPLRIYVLFLYAYVVGYGATTKLHEITAAAFGCLDCPRGLLIVSHGESWFQTNAHIQEIADVVLLSTTAAILVVKWWRGSPAYRRVIGPVLLIGAIPSNVFATLALTSWFDLTLDTRLMLIRAYGVTLTLVPIMLLIGMLRTRRTRGAVGDLVVNLQGGASPERLREALARTLRDPSLEIAYYLPESDAYVDEDGRPLTLPSSGSDRAVTVLERSGERLAVLVHDPALLEQPELVEAASAAARLALDNERLQARIRAQLDEVRASRERIVRAGDEERRRVERDLHDGAQQRMLSLGLALRLIRKQSEADDPAVTDTIGRAEEDLRLALSELRELASGIHPSVLARSGLEAALVSLAERSVIPVVLGPSPPSGLPPAVEATVYFVVSEALANAGKHSGAQRARVDVTRNDGYVHVAVADDGIGGADATGSGLVGLTDRVAALGGTLGVESPPGGGTTLRAHIPCA
jgi:signal transduction histidine kinase